jgi:predicted transcriptional regulator
MLLKERVQNTLNDLPNQFSMDELFERLSFIESVERGLDDADNGKVTSDEEFDEIMEEWLK